MATSLKRSQACTATLSAPNPAAGHHQPTHLLETPGHSQASLGQSLVGSLLLSPGSWCTQGMSEPSEHLWWEWGLILNTNSPLRPSCWGFSFALGCRVSPHSSSSAYRLTRVSLTSDMGYLLTAACSSAAQPPLAPAPHRL